MNVICVNIMYVLAFFTWRWSGMVTDAMMGGSVMTVSECERGWNGDLQCCDC